MQPINLNSQEGQAPPQIDLPVKIHKLSCQSKNMENKARASLRLKKN